MMGNYIKLNTPKRDDKKKLFS